MKIVFLIDNMKFSGGRKTFLEYASVLAKKGHSVEVLTLRNKGDLAGVAAAREVPSFAPENVPECDVIVATTPDDVRAAFESGKGRVVHLCQGFEIDDLEQRVQGKIVPLRYQGEGFFASLRLRRKKLEWKKKIREYDGVYSLDTQLLAISPHLKKVLEQRYRKDVIFCGYGIRKEFFHSASDWKPKNFTKENPCRIINIGPLGITFKGIPDTLDAVRSAKKKGLPVHFIRVSPDPASEIEEIESGRGVVDEYHEAMKPAALGDLLRTCDVYISNSLEGEGFGLPAMEALGCGLICILSSISSYLNFYKELDYAFFVPERDSAATTEAMAKIISLSHEEQKKYRWRSLGVADLFSFDKACDNFEKILMDIASKQKK